MENAKAFLKSVAADENLAKTLSAVKSREELVEVAASHGHVLTEQDVNDIAKIASAYAKEQSGEPLTDEELELVSGGFIELFIVVGAAIVAALGTAAGTLIIAGEIDKRSNS